MTTKEIPVEFMVQVHRWDDRASRYRRVDYNLAEGQPFDLCNNRDGHASCMKQHEQDKANGFEVLQMRNQTVDRIQLDPHANCLQIFCSPTQERMWKATRKSVISTLTNVLMKYANGLDDNGHAAVTVLEHLGYGKK